MLDGGWHADQVVSLGHVTVNDNTFQPLNGSTAICPTQPATNQVSIAGSSGGLTVDQGADSNVPDTGTQFRIVDCEYQYLINGKSLGPGTFKVDASINGVPAVQSGNGTSFALK